jgi:hypothetical protein
MGVKAVRFVRLFMGMGIGDGGWGIGDGGWGMGDGG